MAVVDGAVSRCSKCTDFIDFQTIRSVQLHVMLIPCCMHNYMPNHSWRQSCVTLVVNIVKCLQSTTEC